MGRNEHIPFPAMSSSAQGVPPSIEGAVMAILQRVCDLKLALAGTGRVSEPRASGKAKDKSGSSSSND